MPSLRPSFAPLIAVVLWGLLFNFGCKPPETRPALERPSVGVARPVLREIVDWDEYTGRLAAVDSVDVRARVGGYLDAIQFKDGQIVSKGDVLFVIDPRPFKATLSAAQGDADAQASRLELAKNDFERARKLIESKAISQEDFDTRAKEAEAAAAALAAAKARIERARLDVEFTEVKAPLAGRIGRHQVSIGNLVSGGTDQSTVLTNIVTIDPIYCYFDVDERTVLRIRQLIREGKAKSARESEWPVFLGLGREDGFPFQGTINFVDNQINPKTGTLRVRGVFPNPKEALSPGFFGRVRVPIGFPHQGLLVSDRAIDNDQGQKVLYVVNEKKEVVSRSVRLGQLHEGLREITDGLKPDEQVIVRGIQQVRAGLIVEPKLGDMPTSEVRDPFPTTRVAKLSARP
ncbi:MAG TPA: efflux RND transporter periplasmic adaptor subunit [Tepidisphaeraceae bacterium]|nr:efflux RND transporter periplasmic adaptor subunit [Tepidisphaeraceae bacterium]